MRYLIVLYLIFSCMASAFAAEPVPGDGCPAAGATMGSAAGAGGHFMICEGGTWKSIYSYDAAGRFTMLGNQNCANGQVLKFNGTLWACAADDAGSAGITALTGDVTGAGVGTVATAIANNAVTNAKIANNAIVATTKLSATGTKNASTFLRGDNIWAVPSSPAIQYVSATFTVSGSSQTGDGAVSCPAGYKVIGGGCDLVVWKSTIINSHPVSSTGWHCAARHEYTANQSASVYAICMKD